MEVVDFQVVNHEGKLVEKISEIARREKMQKIGVEAGFSYKNYLMFKKMLPEVEFVFSDIFKSRSFIYSHFSIKVFFLKSKNI